MRLNKILLWAATINILIFALVFTISCSGDKGPTGKSADGGCYVNPDSDGNWIITCDDDDGDENRVLYGSGAPGKQGSQGPAGENCWLGPLVPGKGYEVRCGTGSGTSKGYLNGCTIEIKIDDDTGAATKESSIICGSRKEDVIHLCGATKFDPSENECTTSGTLSAVSNDPAYCGPERLPYDTQTQYCGYAEGDDLNEPPTTRYDICGGKGSDLKPYEAGWVDDVYCRYLSKTEMEISGEKAEDFCDGQKLNEDMWKGEYCGWATNNAPKRTVLTGACDAPNAAGTQGPNQIQFGIGYCTVEIDALTNKPKTTTVYTEALCGSSANNKPNNGAWKDEYCGYASAASFEAGAGQTKVYSGLCTDRKGPHQEKYNAGYCVVDYEQVKPGALATIKRDSTTLTEDFCNEDPAKKPNEGSWKGEYCGTDSTGTKVVMKGVCDDGSAPSAEAWNPKEYCAASFDKKTSTRATDEYTCEDGTKPNEGSWKRQYCGYASKKVSGSKTTLREYGCDDGSGPDIDDFGTSYCTVLYEDRLTNKTTTVSVEDVGCAGSKLNPVDYSKSNPGGWNSEYCGYKNSSSEDNDKVYSNMCEDGSKPNEGAFPAAGWCKVSAPGALSSLASDSCGVEGKTKKVYNDKQWLGEYCFANGVIAKCQSGQVAVSGAKSTDTFKCANPNVLAACTKKLVDIAINKGTDTLGYSASNGKCVYEIETVDDDEDETNKLCPRGGDATTELSKDATVIVDCVYKYKPGTVVASATANDAITSSMCNGYKRLDGTASVFKSATAATAAASAAPALCLSRNTLEECLKSGNGYAVPATGTGTGGAIQASDLSAANAYAIPDGGDAKCEFTPIP